MLQLLTAPASGVIDRDEMGRSTVVDLAKYARRAGFVELDRRQLVAYLTLLATDDVCKMCSSIIQEQVFSQNCRLVRVNARHGPDEDEDDADSVYRRANDSWRRGLRSMLGMTHAVGFALAVSRETWVQANRTVDRVQRQRLDEDDGTTPAPAPFTDHEDDVALFPLDVRAVRVFVRPTGDIVRPTYMVALPVVISTGDNPDKSLAQLRTELYATSSSAALDRESLAWHLLTEPDLFVLQSPDDAPDVGTGLIRSKIMRTGARRRTEVANTAALISANVRGAHPIIPIVEKAGGSSSSSAARAGKDGSGEDGLTNEQAREFPALPDMASGEGKEEAGLAYAQHVSQDADLGPIQGAVRAANVPARDSLVYIDHSLRRRKRRPEQPPGSDPTGPMDEPGLDWFDVDSLQVQRNHFVEFRKGLEVSKAPEPVPPAVYIEQMANRLKMAMGCFGIPFGVAQNYGIMNAADEGAKNIIEASKANGFGGQTTSTESAAWTIFQNVLREVAEELEQWSGDTLKHMALVKLHATRTAPIRKEELDKFYAEHGTDDEFFAGDKPRDEKARNDAYERQLRGRLHDEAEHTKSELLMFVLPRPRPLAMVNELFMSYRINGSTVLSILQSQWQFSKHHLELATTLEKYREKVALPPEDEEKKAQPAGNKKKKKK